MNFNRLIGTFGLLTSHAADSLIAPLFSRDSDCGKRCNILFLVKKKKVQKPRAKYPVLKVPGTLCGNQLMMEPPGGGGGGK